MAANFRGICNQRLHWAEQCINSLGQSGEPVLNESLLRDSALYQLQTAYAAHLGDLMVSKSSAWQGQQRATDIHFLIPEVQELQELESSRDWMRVLVDFTPGQVVEDTARSGDAALLASSSVKYNSLDNNMIKTIYSNLLELINRQRDHLQEY